ncbi:MAG: hypothetical protein Q9219_006156 [cf. Caloplaca sp. 3 TL-2023]
MGGGTPILLLDGGLGTTLESPPYNAKFPSDTCLWSSHFLITSPDTLGRVHRAFVEAGADFLLTGTYQASLQGFTATKKPSSPQSCSNASQNAGDVTSGEMSNSPRKDTYSFAEASTLMRTAVPLARKAFSSAYSGFPHASKGKVALSLGAYGATMQPSTEYSGQYEPASMRTADGLSGWHEERLRVFRSDEATWHDVDYVSFETLPVMQEIHAVRRAMAKVNSNEPTKSWWISCVFPNDDLTLPDGSTVQTVVEAMLAISDEKSQRPWGIGVNCTDIKKLDRLILMYEAAAKGVLGSETPAEQWPWLVLYPDGAQGSVYNTETGQWETDPQMKAKGPQIPWHEELTEIIKKTAERGCWKGILVGGCCKTTPDSIRHLRSLLASTKSDTFYLETGQRDDG